MEKSYQESREPNVETTSILGRTYTIAQLEDFIKNNKIEPKDAPMSLLNDHISSEHKYWEEVNPQTNELDIFGPAELIQAISNVEPKSINDLIDAIERVSLEHPHWKGHLDSVLYHAKMFAEQKKFYQPVMLVHIGDDEYQLVNGAHRLTAASLIEKIDSDITVPVLVIEDLEKL